MPWEAAYAFRSAHTQTAVIARTPKAPLTEGSVVDRYGTETASSTAATRPTDTTSWSANEIPVRAGRPVQSIGKAVAPAGRAFQPAGIAVALSCRMATRSLNGVGVTATSAPRLVAGLGFSPVLGAEDDLCPP